MTIRKFIDARTDPPTITTLGATVAGPVAAQERPVLVPVSPARLIPSPRRVVSRQVSARRVLCGLFVALCASGTAGGVAGAHGFGLGVLADLARGALAGVGVIAGALLFRRVRAHCPGCRG